MKQSRVATNHLLTDVQGIWPLPRHRGRTNSSLQRFTKKEKMSLNARDPDGYEEEEQEWVEETDAYYGNDDE